MPNVGRPSFAEVYLRLQRNGPSRVVSSRRTEYEVTAEVTSGRQSIVGRPRRGAVRIHEPFAVGWASIKANPTPLSSRFWVIFAPVILEIFLEILRW